MAVLNSNRSNLFSKLSNLFYNFILQRMIVCWTELICPKNVQEGKFRDISRKFRRVSFYKTVSGIIFCSFSLTFWIVIAERLWIKMSGLDFIPCRGDIYILACTIRNSGLSILLLGVSVLLYFVQFSFFSGDFKIKLSRYVWSGDLLKHEI